MQIKYRVTIPFEEELPEVSPEGRRGCPERPHSEEAVENARWQVKGPPGAEKGLRAAQAARFFPGYPGPMRLQQGARLRGFVGLWVYT